MPQIGHIQSEPIKEQGKQVYLDPIFQTGPICANEDVDPDQLAAVKDIPFLWHELYSYDGWG
jgi:hypothetical protein